MKIMKYREGEPCNHRGCLNHRSHPCEECGRTEGKGEIWVEMEDYIKNIEGYILDIKDGKISPEQSRESLRNQDYFKN